MYAYEHDASLAPEPEGVRGPLVPRPPDQEATFLRLRERRDLPTRTEAGLLFMYELVEVGLSCSRSPDRALCSAKTVNDEASPGFARQCAAWGRWGFS